VVVHGGVVFDGDRVPNLTLSRPLVGALPRQQASPAAQSVDCPLGNDEARRKIAEVFAPSSSGRVWGGEDRPVCADVASLCKAGTFTMTRRLAGLRF